MRTPLLLLLAASATAVTLSAALRSEDPEWVLKTPAPEDNGVLGPLEGWEQHECTECHREVTREWASTLHALAWEDEHYQKDIKKVRRKKSCYGCHIPEPLHGFAGFIPNPDPRDDLRVHGIDCAACHEGEDGQMLGPWGIETEAHASEMNESFTAAGANRLCIACHATNIGPVIGVAKDFNETQVAKDGGSCIGCHMAPVERAHALDGETGEAAPVRKGRSHELQTPRDPAFLRQAIGIEAMVRDGLTVVSITNRTGHRVPGLSQRTLELRIKLQDESGKTRAEVRHTIDKRRYLPVDEALEIEIDGVGAKVHIQGDHDAPGYRRPVRFLDEVFPVITGGE
jgi:hypothetical protein